MGRRIDKRPLARAVFLCYNVFMRIYISGAMAKRPDTLYSDKPGMAAERVGF